MQRHNLKLGDIESGDATSWISNALRFIAGVDVLCGSVVLVLRLGDADDDRDVLLQWPGDHLRKRGTAPSC